MRSFCRGPALIGSSWARTVLATALLAGAVSTVATAAVIVDFEDLTLPPQSAAPGDASQTPFVSHGVQFNRTWSVDYDCCPGAWAYSNQTDLTTPGVGNAFSAYALPNGGGVHDSENFAIANNFQRGEAQIGFSEPAEVFGMFVTNTTYVHRAVVDGEDGAGFVKGPFQVGDWLRLDVFGVDAQDQETGKVEFYLADYRDGNTSAVNDWVWVDLTSLGVVQRLEFDISSTDIGPFGMNTPAFFAMDDLTFVPIPEPFSGVLWAVGLLTVTLVYRRRLSTVRMMGAGRGE